MNKRIVSIISIILVTTLIISSCLTFVKAEENNINENKVTNTLTLDEQKIK